VDEEFADSDDATLLGIAADKPKFSDAEWCSLGFVCRVLYPIKALIKLLVSVSFDHGLIMI
jgi:hypothetical protein